MKLKESNLLQNFVQMANGEGYEFETIHVHKMYDVLFKAFGQFLSLAKNKEKRVAIVINDKKGNFEIAAIGGYEEGVDGNPGGWEMSISVLKEDIEDCQVFNLVDARFIQQLGATAHGLYNMKFNDPSYAVTLMQITVRALLNWLDQNAKEGEEVVLEHDGYFEAKVRVNGTQKEFLIVPSGEVKQYIKDDDISSGNTASTGGLAEAAFSVQAFYGHAGMGIQAISFN